MGKIPSCDCVPLLSFLTCLQAIKISYLYTIARAQIASGSVRDNHRLLLQCQTTRCTGVSLIVKRAKLLWQATMYIIPKATSSCITYFYTKKPRNIFHPVVKYAGIYPQIVCMLNCLQGKKIMENFSCFRHHSAIHDNQRKLSKFALKGTTWEHDYHAYSQYHSWCHTNAILSENRRSRNYK